MWVLRVKSAEFISSWLDNSSPWKRLLVRLVSFLLSEHSVCYGQRCRRAPRSHQAEFRRENSGQNEERARTQRQAECKYYSTTYIFCVSFSWFQICGIFFRGRELFYFWISLLPRISGKREKACWKLSFTRTMKLDTRAWFERGVEFRFRNLYLQLFTESSR